MKASVVSSTKLWDMITVLWTGIKPDFGWVYEISTYEKVRYIGLTGQLRHSTCDEKLGVQESYRL